MTRCVSVGKCRSKVAAVDLDDAGPGAQPDAGDGFLAATGRLDQGLRTQVFDLSVRLRCYFRAWSDGLLRRVRMGRTAYTRSLRSIWRPSGLFGSMPFTAARITFSGSRPRTDAEGLGADATGVAGVPPVLLLLGLARR